MTRDRSLLAAVFLLSLAVLLYELTLTRLFSVLMWYHFASLSIAVALLGFALGGVLVHLRPGLVRQEGFPGTLVPWMSAFALLAALPFAVLGLARLRPGILFPLLSFFHQPYFQPFRQAPPGPDQAVVISMAVLYTLITIPFLAAGVALAGLFLRLPAERFGAAYAADLAGAAAGCLLLAPGLRYAGAPSLLLAAGSAGFLASALLARRSWRWLSFLTALALAVVAAANGPGDTLVRLQFARGQYEPQIRFSAWNALSRVVVYPLTRWEAEQSWGISRRYPGVHPENLGMLVDDAGYTPIVRNGTGVTDPDWAPWHVISLAYLLRPGAQALIIGPGGGRDILAALGSGAGHVTAVELNPLVVGAVQDRFADFSGAPYALPGVRTVIGEGRSRLAREGGRYDVIQASSVFGEISPSAGAFSLSANYLYTREAFSEYWRHLKNDGILSLSRSVFGLRALRLVSLARDLILSSGENDPEGSIAVVRERGLATVLVARGGFTPAELERLQRLAADRGFTIEYLPGAVTQGRFADAIRGKDPTDGRFDISPPTDVRPFFYNNVPRSRFFNIFFRPTERGERHVIVLRTMALGLTVPLAVLLLLPLLIRRDRTALPPAPLMAVSAYFAGIGFGYMSVELVMMHRLALFLGNPTHALTVVLAVMLLSSAAGSLWAGTRFQGRNGALRKAGVALILLIVVLWAVSGALSPAWDLSLGARVLATAALLGPPAFVMGVFMPAGLAALGRVGGQHLVPWAWAINGAASVVGSLGSVILAMNFGYSRALVFGALGYALTFPFMRVLSADGGGARKEVDL
ncbi:MAG: hypothetical protein JSV00_08050 [bacterium]|nr:MAG: hypothetical protein JSV00_08050 [bacterium]